MADKIYKLIFTKDDGSEEVVQFTAPQGEPGEPGEDYVLTDADKSEIAEQVAELVEIPTIVSGVAIDYDQNVKAVNHRGYSAVAPENTIPAYIMSKEKGFKYAECDVSFTSDGVAVLLHDSTIDRTSNGSGSISAMTYADVSKYDFGSWKSSAYTGTRIPTFEEFMVLCKRIGLHPYIELKQNGSYTEAQIQSLVEVVKSCGMAGKVTWISFDSTYLGYVKNTDATARLGFLHSSDVTATQITTMQGLQTEDNEVYLGVKYTSLTDNGVALCIAAGIPLEVWTVNSESDILALNPYITGITSDSLIGGKVLHEAGMVYEYGIDSGSGGPGNEGDGESDLTSELLYDLNFANYSTNGTITNNGSSTNEITIVNTSGTMTNDADGAIVIGYNDSVSVPFSIEQASSTESYTWAVKVKSFELSGLKYDRVMRGDNDVPSVYVNQDSTNRKGKTVVNAKLLSSAVATNTGALVDSQYYVGTNLGSQGACFELTENMWFVFTHDGTNANLYINGILSASQPLSRADSTKNATSIGIGNTNQQADGTFNSLTISDFKVWNRVLTAEEVAALCA
jgi:glycerophosphoryl diester phosphodiesterase